MLYLVIAASTDRTAIRVFCELKARHGTGAVQIVSSEELEMAPHWAFHLDSDNSCSNIRLASGVTLESEAIGAVYQRIRYVQAPQFAASNQYDQEYAAAEIHALLLGWLASLRCPVINPPHPMGLGGLERHLFDWLSLGIQAGLPVVEANWTTGSPERFELLGVERRTICVAGDSVIGEPPDGLKPACLRLASLSRCTLLDISFALSASGWRFCSATPYPSDAGRIVQALERLA